jgi:hypothetical protein
MNANVMIDRINGHRLDRPVDGRWQTMFGEAPADMYIPKRENCQSMTWGELKDCFDGDNPEYPGNDDPGNGEPNEPPDPPDPPDGPGDGS